MGFYGRNEPSNCSGFVRLGEGVVILNPLLKVLFKQIEDNAVIIEKYAKSAMSKHGKFDSYELQANTREALDSAFKGIAHLKNIVEDLL